MPRLGSRKFVLIIAVAVLAAMLVWSLSQTLPWFRLAWALRHSGTNREVICDSISHHCITIFNHREGMSWDSNWAYIVDGVKNEKPQFNEKLIGFADDNGYYTITAHWSDPGHCILEANHAPFRTDRISEEYEIIVHFPAPKP